MAFKSLTKKLNLDTKSIINKYNITKIGFAGFE